MRNAADVIKEDMTYICSGLQEEFGLMSGKRLLVTGGAGFLGYYLIHSLLFCNERRHKGKNIEILVIDSCLFGVPEWLETLNRIGSVELIKHDISKSMPDEIGDCQYIIHAASIASPTYYRRYPLETMDANVNGLRILLDYSKEQKDRGRGMEGFLYLSSSEIYGDPLPNNIPTPEDYFGNVSCTGPRACYDESKRFGETLCYNYARQFDIPVKIARPFNNYGPGLRITDGRVISDFAADIIAGRDIAIYSDGTPRRTFCYVADAIVGYYKILVRGNNAEAYNIGVDSPEISVLDLAERISRIAKEIFGYKGKIVLKKSSDNDYLVNNPGRRRPLLEKAMRHLGYSPRVFLDEGLRRSLLWYYENNGTLIKS